METDQLVVIKQFRFNVEDADWAEFKAHKREIEVLRSLNHPGIPSYLDSFQMPTGFCMVQEYKNAPSLANRHAFNLKQVEKIALSVLEILVYLQERLPPVFHRDIKPENILVDEQLHVFLVDFGFARIGSQDLAASSVVVGTTGFMPPEQFLNQQLSKASDLYSLGATLVCLLSGVESFKLSNYIDETLTLKVSQLLPDLELTLSQWLKTMVAPRVRDRFPDATTALAALRLPTSYQLEPVSTSEEKHFSTGGVIERWRKKLLDIEIDCEQLRLVTDVAVVVGLPILAALGISLRNLGPYVLHPGTTPPAALVDRTSQESGVGAVVGIGLGLFWMARR